MQERDGRSMVKLASNLTANQLINTEWGDTHFNSARLGALREASKKGYDISAYAKPEYSAQKIRTLIAMQQGGVRVDHFAQFDDDDLNAIYLLSIRSTNDFNKFHKSVLDGEPLMHLLDKYRFTF